MFDITEDRKAHPDTVMMGGSQNQRSEKERSLPSYALDELDMARSGFSLAGRPITEEQKRSIFARWGLI